MEINKILHRMTHFMVGIGMTISLLPSLTIQAEDNVFFIGEQGYPTLQEAVDAVEGTEQVTIRQINNFSASNDAFIADIKDNKNIVLDLGGRTLTQAFDHSGIIVDQSNLTITNGTIELATGSKSAIVVEGNATRSGNKHTLTINENVTINTTGTAVMVTNENKACDIEIIINGDINVTPEQDKGDFALYVNGNVKTSDGPTIILGKESDIVSNRHGSVGIYAAGYANWSLNGDIQADNPLSLKSGNFVINGGVYKATGEYIAVPRANGNGTEDTGAAVSLTSNDGYYNVFNITINNGTFESENGYALYEGISYTGETPAAKFSHIGVMNIYGGHFVTNNTDLESAFAITKMVAKNVINLGVTSNKQIPTEYVRGNYQVIDKDGKYQLAPIPVESIVINGEDRTIDLYNSDFPGFPTMDEVFQATITPSNATDKSITWTSSNDSVLKSLGNGMFKPLTTGDVTITATVAGNISDTLNVHIIDSTPHAESISISPTNVELDLNGYITANLTATVTPSDAIETITWSSDKDNIVSVDQTGKITAHALGTAKISAETSNRLKDEIEVSVVDTTPIPSTGVTLSPSTIALDMNGTTTATLTATISPANSTDSIASWISSNEDVATVNNGVITALSVGVTEITVTTTNGQSAKATVTVKDTRPIPVENISVSPSTVSLDLNGKTTATLTATITPENATDKTLIWESSDSSVVTVKDGVITALKTGKATITVKTLDKKQASVTVNVVDSTPAPSTPTPEPSQTPAPTPCTAPVIEVPTVPTEPVNTTTPGMKEEEKQQAQEVINDSVKDVVSKIVSDDTNTKAVKLADGIDETTIKEILAKAEEIEAKVEAKPIDVTAVKEEEKKNTESTTATVAKELGGEFEVDSYLDLSVNLVAKLGNEGDKELGKLTELTKPITFTLAIPEKVKQTAKTYLIVRNHELQDGTIETSIIVPTVNADGTLSFETDKFSTYALIYSDKVLDTSKYQGTPVKPDKPTATVKPTSPSKTPSKTPNTGITTGVKFFSGIIALMALALGIIVVLKKKLS